MPNVLITADLHLHNHQKDLRKLEDGLECLRWIYKTARNNNCKNLIVAGDLFHDRNYIHTVAYFEACKIITENKDIQTYLLLGNHDMYREHTWNCPNSLESLKQITILIDSPKTIRIDGLDIDFLPYTPTPSKYFSLFKPSRLLISHLGLVEAILNATYDVRGVEDDSGEKEPIKKESFSKWEKVFLGHYHYPQKLDNVEYIGSPMALTFGEANQDKHVIIFNTDDFSQKYVKNEISPKYFILDNVLDLDKINVHNSYVRIKSKDEYQNSNQFEITKKVKDELGARDVQVILIKKDISQETDKALKNIDNFFGDKEKIIEHYISSNQELTLDKNKLKEIGMEILCNSKE